MNDLPLYVNSDFDMYADNSTLHAGTKTQDDLELILNNDMECLSKWFKQNRTVTNTDKTKCMLITTFQKATRLPRTDLNIVLDNVTLDNVDSEKLLGVIIDKYLAWKYHVGKTAKTTTSKNIAQLHRIKKYLSHQTHLTFYKTHIQPHLDYCNTIWGLSTHVPRIFTLQKMALRIIINVPKLTHSVPLFNKCEIMTIQIE